MKIGETNVLQAINNLFVRNGLLYRYPHVYCLFLCRVGFPMVRRNQWKATVHMETTETFYTIASDYYDADEKIDEQVYQWAKDRGKDISEINFTVELERDD